VFNEVCGEADNVCDETSRLGCQTAFSYQWTCCQGYFKMVMKLDYFSLQYQMTDVDSFPLWFYDRRNLKTSGYWEGC
jgi:hypothetical protein